MSENSAPLSLNSVSQPGTPGQPLNTWGQRPLSEYEDREVHLIPASNRPQSAVYPCLPTAPDLGSQGFNRPKPVQPGNRKCGNDECVACAWMIEGPHFSSTVTNKQYRFMPTVTCTDTSLIYLVTCRRCRKQYVGKTQQSLRERHYGHRREIDTQSSPLGKHFAETCGIDSWRIQIIDQCPTSELNRREGHWIKELSSLSPVGLNIRDETRGNKNIH
ncbi:uncharacterized protein LOC111712333 [Eurytemora carolleeae]|uniref:uncharacterized protein LOC111712333 n=1 Tax=Eurytemora carolleeae TaxID=1294199 RepID=UPI000C76F33B|nr:uncharacterized protein LOC111712333 [Eurytemora carolleeae]|eukprot:XP_023342679.1 uncharacterized protein LOC111712333 [Eurytemora affinis]